MRNIYCTEFFYRIITLIRKYIIYIICFTFLFTSYPLSLQSQEIVTEKLRINSGSSNELAPFVHDSVLYFVSNRKSSVLVNIFNQDNEHLYKLYRSKIYDDGKIGRAEQVNLLSSRSLTIGPSVISSDGDFLLSTLNRTFSLRNARLTADLNLLGIYQFNRDGNTWGDPLPMPLMIEGYSVGQPSLSPDGKMLFFVSDKPGGFGDTDIYVSEKGEDGWEEPQNLGPLINSSGSELFPFFHPSGKLYFSSNGHEGFGGFDIFYSIYDDGWTEPVLLREPINSSSDDYSCFMFDDELSGFFASNRDGVDDIFHFKYEIEFCPSPNEVVEDIYCFTFFEDSGLDTDTIPLDYQWEFSDGGKEFGIEVDHCFPGPGYYEVFLHAVDSVTGDFQYAVAEYELELEETKQVYFSLPDTVKLGEPVSITASLSGYGEVGDVEYFWELNDGEKVKGVTIQHIFRTKGIYRVCCEAIWDEGKICSYRMVMIE